MPLYEDQLKAICRITHTDGGTDTRGTGFLVGPGQVLTAFHVVGDRKRKILDAGPFTLAFGPRSKTQKPFVTHATKILDSDADADWAIVVPEDDPPAEPFGIGDLPRGYVINWTTWGFPDIGENAGQGYDGRITIAGDEIQLLAVQALEKEASQVGGLSGSPCVVNGRAIGIIVAASDPKKAGYTAGGALFAVPMRRVASAFITAKMPPESPPPFLSVVADHLLGMQAPERLKEIGKPLGLPVDSIDERRLPLEVATAILHGGWKRTSESVLSLGSRLKREYALDILYCGGSLWIDASAAGLLESAATTGAYPVIGLNVSRLEAATRYVHRAGYGRANHPGWRQFAWPLAPPAGEDQLRGLFDGVKEILRKKFGCADDGIATALKGSAMPVFILVPLPTPDARHLACLRRAFKCVNFVALLGTGISDDCRKKYEQVTFIEPLLFDGVEAAADTAYRNARVQVQLVYAEESGATG